MPWCNATLFRLAWSGWLDRHDWRSSAPCQAGCPSTPEVVPKTVCKGRRVQGYRGTSRVCSVRRYEGRYEGTKGVRLGEPEEHRFSYHPLTPPFSSLSVPSSALSTSLCVSFFSVAGRCGHRPAPTSASLPSSPMGPQCTILFLILGGRH